MQLYFNKFPTIEYSNTLVRDISRRVIFPPHLQNIATAFYPYDIQNAQRSDVISYAYYNDTDADWLIYLVNQIIDPYYGWYLDNDQFQQYILSKYGNLTDPQQRIFYWVTNWTDDQSPIPVNYFNVLPTAQQKYYMPNWSPNNQIIYYTRRQEDWFMNTNQVWSLNVANSVIFNVGDLVQSITNSAFIEGQAEVVGVGNNIVIVKNIANNISVGSKLCEMTNNLANTNISAVSTVTINIPLSEAVYWTPITYYLYEQIVNEKNKSLILLDAQYLNDASNALQTNINA